MRRSSSALNLVPAPESWASVDDVAKHLGVAKDSVYRSIERRAPPAHRIGRPWKFKLSEVDACFLEKPRPLAQAPYSSSQVLVAP